MLKFSFDIDKFVNFPLNNGESYYATENGCGCIKGALAACTDLIPLDGRLCISEVIGLYKRLLYSHYPKNHIWHKDKILMLIFNRAESILMGTSKEVHEDCSKKEYSKEQRKVKSKEFVLRALNKYGYIGLPKKVKELVKV